MAGRQESLVHGGTAKALKRHVIPSEILAKWRRIKRMSVL
jgi:hypothetical protein